MLKQFAVGLFASFLAFTVSSQAQTYEEAVALPNALIFSVTAGSWSEEVELAQEADVETTPETDSGTDSSTVSTDAVEVMLMEGYYRLSAFEKV
jgi:hypothetical protein